MTKTKGTRLPEDWRVTEDLIAYGQDLGFQVARIHRIAEEFKNYWLAESGQKASKLDWKRTFQNWLLRTADREGVKPKPKPTSELPLNESKLRDWRSASYPVKGALEAMHEAGATDAALTDFFTRAGSGGLVLTDITGPTTFVVKNTDAADTFFRSLTVAAEKAGINHQAVYTGDFVRFFRKTQQMRDEGIDDPNERSKRRREL